jgi:hypothetical protein
MKGHENGEGEGWPTEHTEDTEIGSGRGGPGGRRAHESHEGHDRKEREWDGATEYGEARKLGAGILMGGLEEGVRGAEMKRKSGQTFECGMGGVAEGRRDAAMRRGNVEAGWLLRLGVVSGAGFLGEGFDGICSAACWERATGGLRV